MKVNHKLKTFPMMSFLGFPVKDISDRLPAGPESGLYFSHGFHIGSIYSPGHVVYNRNAQ